MTDISEIATVTDAKTIKEQQSTSKNNESCDVAMEDGVKRKYNKKTLKDENGSYPIWLHPRKIKKVKRANKKNKSKNKKKK